MLLESGVDFEAADMPTANKLLSYFLNAIAERQKEVASERIKAGLTAAKDRGVRLGKYARVLSRRNRDAALGRAKDLRSRSTRCGRGYHDSARDRRGAERTLRLHLGAYTAFGNGGARATLLRTKSRSATPLSSLFTHRRPRSSAHTWGLLRPRRAKKSSRRSPAGR